MGRGRRPNLALEPTRALQTQRAFRQRKAEHLASLELAVKQLTEENAKLRQLVHADTHSPRSPSNSSSSVGTSGSSSLPAVSAAASTPTSQPPTCESCAPVLQANRQLALAAAHVDAQIAQLQHAVRSLRSVLHYHHLPVPAHLASPALAPSDLPPDDARYAKRVRAAETYPHRAEDYTSPGPAGPTGVHMTTNFFAPGSAAGSPPAYEGVATTRRTTTGAWASPSPSTVMGAPTPPSAGYSPRHSHAGYSPAPSSGEGGVHRSRRSGRQTSTGSARLPPPSAMSPARYATQLPPIAPEPPRRRDDWAASPYQPPPSPLHSPRVRSVASPRASVASGPYEAGRGVDKTACAPIGKSSCCPSKPEQSAEVKSCTPPGKISNCRPTRPVEPAPNDEAWSAPAPLGIAFDMRTSQNASSATDTSEHDCCLGLVKCDDQGRIII